MSTHTIHLLREWKAKPELDWVLATLVAVEGSSYRRPGAMMLINSLGQFYGMISGGCLESDIVLKSRQTMNDGKSRLFRYDMSDESDLGWRLGIGCGGCIDVLIQAVTEENQFLQLNKLLKRLEEGQSCHYLQAISGNTSKSDILELENFNAQDIKNNQKHPYQINRGDTDWFVNNIEPQIHLAVLGGGIDARPLVNMASALAWKVSLCDPREVYARKKDFPLASDIYKSPLCDLKNQAWLQQIDACVIMHHNINLDAQALDLVQASSARYVGMLGPSHRTERVFEAAKHQYDQLTKPLFNPIGLNLGGNGPESIALSILSEIQAQLSGANTVSLSQHNTSLIKGQANG